MKELFLWKKWCPMEVSHISGVSLNRVPRIYMCQGYVIVVHKFLGSLWLVISTFQLWKLLHWSTKVPRIPLQPPHCKDCRTNVMRTNSLEPSRHKNVTHTQTHTHGHSTYLPTNYYWELSIHFYITHKYRTSHVHWLHNRTIRPHWTTSLLECANGAPLGLPRTDLHHSEVYNA